MQCWCLFSQSKAGCQSEWSQTSLPAVSTYSIKRLVGNAINCTQLVDINVPVKDNIWPIFELAAGYSQTPIHWKLFVALMDEVLGFQTWETYFDCSFVPRFHKRVFVGKEMGNNISGWEHLGAITFRIPTKGLIDRCILITMFERLGTFFAKNGIRVTFQREVITLKFDENGKATIIGRRGIERRRKPYNEPSNHIGHPLAENGPNWKEGMPKPDDYFAGWSIFM